jgi:nucleoside-diphosphate-sugar epimerase
MVLPRWLRSRSQPIAVDDVVAALTHALTLPSEARGAYALPGPDTLSGRDILLRIARLRGTRPLTLSVPVLTPRLSSYWIDLVTRADHAVAHELVEGLKSDLTTEDEGFWRLMPGHARLSFDEAAARALAAEERTLSFKARATERLLRRAHPRAPSP